MFNHKGLAKDHLGQVLSQPCFLGTRRIDVTDEAVINEFNCTEQIYKRYQAPFGLN